MFLDLYIALDLKSNPMDSSHFENNFKRTINCPATRANVNESSIRSRTVETDPKQFCMARAGGQKLFRWWSRSWNLVSGSTELVCEQASCTNNAVFYSVFWTKLVWSRSQSFKILKPEPKNFDAWSWSLKFEYWLQWVWYAEGLLAL